MWTTKSTQSKWEEAEEEVAETRALEEEATPRTHKQQEWESFTPHAFHHDDHDDDPP